jgi:hypothetical protein
MWDLMGRTVLCVACHETGFYICYGVQAESPSANQAFPVSQAFLFIYYEWYEEALMSAGDKVLDRQKRLEVNQEQGTPIEATLSTRESR